MPTSDTAQDLVDLLDIDVVGLVESKHARIRKGYKTPLMAEDFEDFKRITIDYVRYHHKRWLGTDIGAKRAWEQVREAFDEISSPELSFSRKCGFLEVQGEYIQAIKNSLTGRHGGLIATVDALTRNIQQKAARHWIQSIFLSGVEALSDHQKVAFVREYLNRYGHLLEGGVKTISAHELATQLENLIETHVKVVNDLRTGLRQREITSLLEAVKLLAPFCTGDQRPSLSSIVRGFVFA